MKRKPPCKYHRGTCFPKLDLPEVEGYRKYVGGLRKCVICNYYIGDASLKKKDRNLRMEAFISKTYPTNNS